MFAKSKLNQSFKINEVSKITLKKIRKIVFIKHIILRNAHWPFLVAL